MTRKIEAIIREEKLNVFEVRGHGRQGGITLAGRSGSYQVDMLPRVQLNIILSDHNVEKTIDTIRTAALTGNIGDGIIFVYPVEEVIRIRTGERGRPALRYAGDIDDQLEQAAPDKANGGNGHG